MTKKKSQCDCMLHILIEARQQLFKQSTVNVQHLLKTNSQYRVTTYRTLSVCTLWDVIFPASVQTPSQHRVNPHSPLLSEQKTCLWQYSQPHHCIVFIKMAEQRDLLLQEQLSGPAPIPCGQSLHALHQQLLRLQELSPRPVVSYGYSGYGYSG